MRGRKGKAVRQMVNKINYFFEYLELASALGGRDWEQR